MKKIKYFICIVTIAIFSSSCDSFFDVNPKTDIIGDVLFQKETGFRDALAGVYIQLKDGNAYGEAMTMTTIENLVSSWDVTSNSTEYWLGMFNYENASAQTALNNIYRQEYAIIASINEILEHIDNKKDVFTPTMYEIIKGECLALRAYCHFDILRLFGPIPNAPTVGNRLPYVKIVSKAQNPLLSFDAFKTELLNDLSQAESLLKDVDPFINHSIDDFKKGIYKPENDFLSYRYLRMNYYAVKALQARAFLWFNEKEKAYQAAKTVIDAKNSDGSVKFRLGNSSDFAANDYVLTNEHIFGLYDFQLYSKYQRMFGSGNVRKGVNEIQIQHELFNNTGTDIRESDLWELITISSQSRYVLKKYKVPENYTAVQADVNQIPMLRISEMYFIAMETGPDSESQQLWASFKTSRNFTDNDLPADETQRRDILLKEYRKEFYGEGQAFFAYKRVNAPQSAVLFVPADATLNYLLPMPKIETTIIK